MSPLLLTLLSLLSGAAAFGRLRHLAPGHPTTPGRRVGIVVPARDEEASIGNLLGDLERQTLRPSVVVVVDDHSADATAAIASGRPGVTLVANPPLPGGWFGKPWACETGVAAACETLGDDDLLVFLDADVRLRLDALAALVGAADEHPVVSVQPHHLAPGGVEQLSAVFNLVSLMGVGAGWPRPTAIFGPVICCSVADYRRVGGHRAVRAAVAEDVELGHRFLDAGLPLRVMGGGGLIGFRMYPGGLRSMIEGWSKNMATGAASIPRWRMAAVALWVTGLVAASSTYVSIATGAAPLTWSAAGVVAATGAFLAALLRRVGTFRWWAVAAFPVLVAFFVAVFARSAWMTYVRRSVDWRGRTLDLHPVADLQPVPRGGTP